MKYRTKKGDEIAIDYFRPGMEMRLSEYLMSLSPESASRFGPHPFDVPSVQAVFSGSTLNTGFIATLVNSPKIIAYALVRDGILEWDRARLQSYGLDINDFTDCTYAPSVGDRWQNTGIGQIMFDCLRREMACSGKKRIILWGGVQASNERAVAFYLKNGFRLLGEFEHNGKNLDMVLDKL